MACYETGTVISLANREAITLPRVGGATLRVTQGTLWVTEERDGHDVVLRPGDNFVVESDGNTVVEAQNDAVFCIVGRKSLALELQARTQARAKMLDRLAALARRFATPPRQVPYV
jgi:hypothetical protein